MEENEYILYAQMMEDNKSYSTCIDAKSGTRSLDEMTSPSKIELEPRIEYPRQRQTLEPTVA